MTQKADSVYNSLVYTCERLLGIVKSLRGLSNKELDQLTDQVNSLADKWERK